MCRELGSDRFFLSRLKVTFACVGWVNFLCLVSRRLGLILSSLALRSIPLSRRILSSTPRNAIATHVRGAWECGRGRVVAFAILPNGASMQRLLAASAQMELPQSLQSRALVSAPGGSPQHTERPLPLWPLGLAGALHTQACASSSAASTATRQHVARSVPSPSAPLPPRRL